MANKRKKIKVFLFVLIGILTISVGYASISAINLLINGNGTVSVNQNNFKVHFIEAKEITGTTGVSGTSLIKSDDTKASFTVTGLSKVGDYAEAKYIVKNDSNGIGAEIILNLTNSNPEYFKITETVGDNKLQAGDTTLAIVKVEMIKTPINDSVTTKVSAKLIASPLENDSATGGNTDSKVEPTAFATDSWATIKTNVQNGNTNQYNIGDIKEVTINGTDYTVRIANKTTGDHCGDNDTAYSQTACGFVVEFVDIIEQRAMNSTNTNVGGWPGSELYTYLQGTFYNSLPNELKSAIKPTRVISGYGCNGTWDENKVCDNPDNNGNNFSSTDNIYLLSGVELLGADEYDTAASTTHQLDYYVGQPVKQVSPCGPSCGVLIDSYPRMKKQYNGSDRYWLRPAFYINYNNFRDVNNYGSLSGSDAYYSFGGVAPAFRIG